METLISVIIPVYNVEAYLARCIDSVLAQTYANLEILLVDDGATDTSGAICDEYAARDSRIRVIHKANGGLSDARNAGLEACRGEYVVFIDSDDYISPLHIQNLWEALSAHDADIAVSDFLVSESSDAAFRSEKTQTLCYTTQEALREMFYAKAFSCSACGKLYRKAVFGQVRFPKGMLFEDLYTIPRVTQNASRVVFSDDVTYCYFQRSGSIVHSGISTRHFAGFDMLDAFLEQFQNDPRILRAIRTHYLTRALEYMKQLTRDQDDLIHRLWEYTKAHRRCALTDARAPMRTRLFAALSYLGYPLTDLFVKTYYR